MLQRRNIIINVGENKASRRKLNFLHGHTQDFMLMETFVDGNMYNFTKVSLSNACILVYIYTI